MSQQVIVRLIDAGHDLVRCALKEYASETGWEGRNGGYLCVAEPSLGFPVLVIPLGDIPEAKGAKYLRLCIEKAARLASHPDHTRSMESRNPDAEQYGGAVRLAHAIFSFSGFPEQADEALVVAIARSVHDLTDLSEDEAIVKTISEQNPYFRTFWEFGERAYPART